MSEPIKSTYIHVEQTLAVIKPDAIDKSDEIEELVLQNGFSILQVLYFILFNKIKANFLKPECFVSLF